MSFSNRWPRALITGAAGGIGRCFANTLAADGVALGLLDLSALDETASRARGNGARVFSRRADVGDARSLAAAVEELAAELGGIDLVIHCAAILGPGTFTRQPAADFERVLGVNLGGTANVVRAVVPLLKAGGGGAIACIASTAALHGWPEMSAYSAAKFAVAGLCDALRPELERDGIVLTSVFPLLIDTPLIAGPDPPPILKTGRPIAPQAVVDKTLAAVKKRKARVFVPQSVRVVAALQGLAPSLLDAFARRFGMRRR
jgi:3-oxoacyl-[acyl-carrier protein] reductase